MTRATLLLKLRDGHDHHAWNDFVDNYGPMLYRFVRNRGLQDADAADVVQEVMRRVGMSIGQLDYAKEKGGFRAWLFTITRNALSTFLDRKRRAGFVGNDSAQYAQLQQVVDQSPSVQENWNTEHERTLAARAMALVQTEVESKTWQAFEMTAIDGLSAAEVGRKLKMSAGAIYVAKSRVIARLRTEIERMQNEDE